MGQRAAPGHRLDPWGHSSHPECFLNSRPSPACPGSAKTAKALERVQRSTGWRRLTSCKGLRGEGFSGVGDAGHAASMKGRRQPPPATQALHETLEGLRRTPRPHRYHTSRAMQTHIQTKANTLGWGTRSTHNLPVTRQYFPQAIAIHFTNPLWKKITFFLKKS